MACCCCGSGKGSNANQGNSGSSYSKKSGGPPSSDAMKDRGDEILDEDKKAVAWLRSRSLENLNEAGDSVPQLEKLPPITMPPEAPIGMAISRSFEDRGQLEVLGDLETPYPLDGREVPLRPQDGNILHPAAIRKDASTNGKVEMVEVFEPQVSVPSTKRAPQLGIPVVGPHGQVVNAAMPVEEKTHRLEAALQEEKPETKQKTARAIGNSKFTEVAGRVIPPQRSSSEDRLSDVPSDVDSVTKERYLLACHLLKTTLIEKETALIPLEREFILSLLSDNEKDPDGQSDVSQDRVSAIEKATLRLGQDPLFQTEDPDRPPAPSPMTAATLARSQRQKQAGQLQNQSEAKSKQEKAKQTHIPKHRHTATRKAKPSGETPHKQAGGKESSDTKIMPVENHDKAVKSSEKEALVRFDGWSFHRPEDQSPFRILGADDAAVHPRVLTPSMMEAFRGFFPYTVSESNFWLKFSLVRDGASLATLLSRVRASSYTIIAVETMHGEVFGSFTGSPWRTGTRWFGSGEAFLWRLKKSRLTSPKHTKQSNFENEMEVYPFTGSDDLIQYCTSRTMAVGGGDWLDTQCSFEDEPKGIGFMIDGDLQGGETNSCATFANPRLSKRASTTNEFSISNLEVWTLTPCLTVKDAARLEVQKLFVEENRI